MAIAQSLPVRFTPRGLADAFDSTDVFSGACRNLVNLTFDQSNPEIVVARPGVDAGITSFAGFTTPGFVSLQQTIGTRIYGMVATGLTAGHDEPFVYDIPTATFIAVTGVTAGNAELRPASPTTSGDWAPPTMTMVGIKLIITHPGYTGAGASFFGAIDISNPAAPAYTTQNTATHALPSVPTGVANLNNRAYFICGNMLYYSDVLVPLTMTNAGQALTLGDNTPVAALSGLPIQTSTAGVVSALLAFKATQIWQITGDAAITGSLSFNYLSLTVGTTAPRSICSTPFGTVFAGPDTAYAVTPFGAVIPVTNQLGQVGSLPDLRQPFGFMTVPSRACAAFTSNIYRLCMHSIVDGIEGVFDYWFDTRKMRWTGPHTFPYDSVSAAGTYFILSGAGSGAKLFRSDPFFNINTVYLDNGSTFNVDMKSADFPKRGEMDMKQVVESTVELSSSGASVTYNVQAFDDKANQIAVASVTTVPTGGVWGANSWGDGTRWGSKINQPKTYAINWAAPLVFNKLAIEINTQATDNVAIGTFQCRTQKTGYTLQG